MSIPTNAPTSVALAIFEMSCDHCVRAVTRALTATPGVKLREVSLGSAVIEAGDGGAAALAALDEAGFPARVVPTGPAGTPGGGCSCGGGC